MQPQIIETLDPTTRRATARLEVMAYTLNVLRIVSDVAKAMGWSNQAVGYFLTEGLDELLEVQQTINPLTDEQLHQLQQISSSLIRFYDDAIARDKAEGVYQLVAQFTYRTHALGMVDH
jgi:hypothetical protein